MKSYAVMQSPGPNWKAGKPVFEQPLLEHGRYMKRLHEAGTLKHGGPFMDSSGGLWIFEAEDEAAARKIVEDDPALQEGIMNSDWHEWMAIDWEEYSP